MCKYGIKNKKHFNERKKHGRNLLNIYNSSNNPEILYSNIQCDQTQFRTIANFFIIEEKSLVKLEN